MNKRKAWSTILHRFHKKSVFIQITYIVFVLSVIFGAVFSFAISSHMYNSNKKSALKLYMDNLDSVIENGDKMIQNSLSDSIAEFWSSKSIITLLFMSGDNLSSVESDVIWEIHNKARYNDLISNLVLYVPSTGTIYSSETFTAEQYDSSMADDYIRVVDNNLINCIRIYGATSKSRLFFYNHYFFVVSDFPDNSKHRRGSVYCSVDLRRFYWNLTESVSDNVSLYIFDFENKPIFTAGIEYPDYLTEEVIYSLEASPDSMYEADDQFLIYSSSEECGWKYIYAIDSDIFPSVRFLFWSLFFVFFAGLFILQTAAVSYLYKCNSRIIFRIASLLDSGYEPGGKTAENESEYIDRTIEALSNHCTDMRHIVNQAAEDMINRLFLELFSGKQMSYEVMNDMLSAAQSNFQINAFYTVVVLKCRPAGGNLSLSERNTVMEACSSAIENINSKYILAAHVMPTNYDCFAAVFAFREKIPYSVCYELLNMFCSEVSHMCRFNSDMYTFGFGRMYKSLYDIGLSYSDAVLDIDNRAVQLNDDAPDVSDEIVSDKKAEKIIALIMDQKPDEAGLFIERIMDSIKNDSESDEEKSEYYKTLVQCMMKSISGKQLHFPSAIISDSPWNSSEDHGAIDVNTLEESARQTCRQIVNKLSQMVRVQKKPPIVEATKYIAENYGDSSLSLGSVAETVDYSSNYLSRLFSDGYGMSFTEYLNIYRISEAKTLLLETDNTLNEIAEKTGFNSSQNFIRVFRRITGQTPGQYRKEACK